MKAASALLNPTRDLRELLLGIEKPARYVGGEYGSIHKDIAEFRTAIAFPDLYEIGMSNQALRIIYNGLNRLDGISCERVFAPAPDFEDALKRAGVPLYTLERGAPLYSLDMLGITMGYELGITGALSILNSGGIPINAEERGHEHPIIIMGGPAISNPAPFARFVDAVWIGEAEAGFFDLVAALRDLKRIGAGRGDLLQRLSTDSAIWMPGKKARRAIYSNFATNTDEANVFPVSSMRIVQDHGTVEIMRGCPNGCRFCHAGLWYRPMRQKSERQIRSEVKDYIRMGGYREITLSSLSSGDYVGIGELVSNLNETYREDHVSFQLPSLKVSTFSLALLDQLSEVRKSGLTFAVETPIDAWQMAINKDVCRENVISILHEAKARGWRSAKFYFMIGLPVEDKLHRKEEEEIVDFLIDVSHKSGVQINVNVGTFVPKPHTPYQWVPQLSTEEAEGKFTYIKNMLRRGNFKVGTHDPFTSTLEGVISRGDERVGKLISAAFNAGCRLDAWNEYMRKDIWQELLSDQSEILNTALLGRNVADRLPWDDIDAGIGKGFLKREYLKSQSGTFTSPCKENCTDPCGSCSDGRGLVQNSIQSDKTYNVDDPCLQNLVLDREVPKELHPNSYRLVFSFTKTGPAIFIPHLSVIEVFSKAFIRSSLPIKYTEGFNPLPRLNFAAPLSVGVLADAEIAVVETHERIKGNEFIERLNTVLPQGFMLVEAFSFSIPEGIKKVSAASMLWGFTYVLENGCEMLIPVKDEKQFRMDNSQGISGSVNSGLHRMNVLAKNDLSGSFESYFDAYKQLYEQYK